MDGRGGRAAETGGGRVGEWEISKSSGGRRGKTTLIQHNRQFLCVGDDVYSCSAGLIALLLAGVAANAAARRGGRHHTLAGPLSTLAAPMVPPFSSAAQK